MRDPDDGVLGETPIDVVITDEPEREAAPDAPSDTDAEESLNRLERLAAGFGAWVATLADRWNLHTAPTFVDTGLRVSDLPGEHSSGSDENGADATL